MDSLPPRMLRFRLRMDRFNYTIEYVPEKELYTADTLSRAPVESQNHPEDDMQEQLFAEMIVTGLPASADRLETFRQAQQNDPVCSKLLSYYLDGWPSKYNISPDLREYWQYRASLTAVNKLLLYGCRIVVPTALRSDILMKIHEGHLGILKCQERTRESVWWPGVSSPRRSQSFLLNLCISAFRVCK